MLVGKIVSQEEIDKMAAQIWQSCRAEIEKQVEYAVIHELKNEVNFALHKTLSGDFGVMVYPIIKEKLESMKSEIEQAAILAMEKLRNDLEKRVFNHLERSIDSYEFKTYVSDYAVAHFKNIINSKE